MKPSTALLRTALPLAATLSLAPASAAQQFGPEQPISTSTSGAAAVHAADLDGDGDPDVLTAGGSDDTVAWHKNTLGSFGPRLVISSAASCVASVFAADLDGDGDLDVLSAWSCADTIAWHENTNGFGVFGAPQVVTTAAAGAFSVHAADLDGDGDQDVLSASQTDAKVAWYANDDGLGTFGSQQVIDGAAPGADSVRAADVDGDGDLDVLAAANGIDTVAWYENTDGMGAFGAAQVVSAAADGAFAAVAADVDGDGDLDVVSASLASDEVAWHPNTDGAGTFGAALVVSTAAAGPVSVFAGDLENDGDVDVISASRNDGVVAWYENTGGGAFAPQEVISSTAACARAVFAADLDGGGDLDVLSASGCDDKIAWYENAIPPPPPPAAMTTVYGCGVNPAGSMLVGFGAPTLGGSVVLGLDNPLGTQATGAIPFLVFALFPDPAFPCGTPIPGLGMAGPGAAGELLISLAPPTPIAPVLAGPPWAGPGMPSAITVLVPADPELLGASVFAQGLLLDPTVAFGVRFGLTNAVELRIGV